MYTRKVQVLVFKALSVAVQMDGVYQFPLDEWVPASVKLKPEGGEQTIDRIPDASVAVAANSTTWAGYPD